MLFSHQDAKYLSLNNTPPANESTVFTSEPLNLGVDVNVLGNTNLFVMSGISRVQQYNTEDPMNAIYRISVSELEAAITNTGNDHRGDLRRSILMTGIMDVAPGNHQVALEVCIFKYHIKKCSIKHKVDIQRIGAEMNQQATISEA